VQEREAHQTASLLPQISHAAEAKTQSLLERLRQQSLAAWRDESR